MTWPKKSEAGGLRLCAFKAMQSNRNRVSTQLLQRQRDPRTIIDGPEVDSLTCDQGVTRDQQAVRTTLYGVKIFSANGLEEPDVFVVEKKGFQSSLTSCTQLHLRPILDLRGREHLSEG